MVAGQPVALGPRGETRAIPTGQPPIRPPPQTSVARLVRHFRVITGGPIRDGVTPPPATLVAQQPGVGAEPQRARGVLVDEPAGVLARAQFQDPGEIGETAVRIEFDPSVAPDPQPSRAILVQTLDVIGQ